MPRWGSWRVLLVGHSMGGVVARAALARLAVEPGFGAGLQRPSACQLGAVWGVLTLTSGSSAYGCGTHQGNAQLLCATAHDALMATVKLSSCSTASMSRNTNAEIAKEGSNPHCR